MLIGHMCSCLPFISQHGNSNTLIVFSTESANTDGDDPPMVDPVTDALAAAIYKVLELLEQKVWMLFVLFKNLPFPLNLFIEYLHMLNTTYFTFSMLRCQSVGEHMA